MKKYEFTGETMTFQGHFLRRIRYLRYVGHYTMKGDVGGWIESEDNLSQEGNCCVLNEAKVFGSAKVIENASIMHSAIVKDNAQLMGNSFISGRTIVGADTIISGHSSVSGDSEVFFYLTPKEVSKYSKRKYHLFGNTHVTGRTSIQATGYIKESEIISCTLYGRLSIEKKNYDDIRH